jgi:hypothetical protein
MQTGMRSDWSWVVFKQMISELPLLIAECHPSQHLFITAFDSGPIFPSEEEQRLGWTMFGETMVSPPLSAALEIPAAEHDEWYVFPDPRIRIMPDEIFVNYSGFTLVDAKKIELADESRRRWLLDAQSRFWASLDRLQPSSYVSSGNIDIIVTRNQRFLDRVIASARTITG